MSSDKTSVGRRTSRPDHARSIGPALDAHYVLERLIEATYTKRRGDIIARANLGLENLRFLVRLARDLWCLDHRRYEHAARSLDETGRKVGAWSKAQRAQESPRSV